jgi:hypothetical protein
VATASAVYTAIARDCAKRGMALPEDRGDRP